jgi:myosin heavy subunit
MSDIKALNEWKRKTEKLQAEYEDLHEQLEEKKSELAAKKREVAEAEAESQEIDEKKKRLQAQEKKLDDMIRALKVGKEVTADFDSSITEQQRNMNKAIKDQYDKVKSFHTNMTSVNPKKNAETSTRDKENSIQKELLDIVMKVKEALAKKGAGEPAAGTSQSTPAAQNKAPVRRRAPGRPAGSGSAKKKTPPAATPAKRKRDSTSDSATTPRTTPARSARKAKTYYQESDDSDEAEESPVLSE